MKKLLLASVLALASTSANAWTDRWGHWQEGPYYPDMVPPSYSYNPYPPVPPYYGPPAYGGPVVVVPPPTDAQVIAGTILGIAGMFAHGRHW